MTDANFSPQPMQTATYTQSPFVPSPAPPPVAAPAAAPPEPPPPPPGQPATPAPTDPASRLDTPKPVKTVTGPAPDMQPQTFQRYTPASTTHHREWGKPPWGTRAIRDHPAIVDTTHMPHPNEATGIIQGAGRQLGTWGSPSVQPLAQLASGLASIVGPALDFFSHNAFSTAYRENMLGGLQAQQMKLRMQSEQMQIDHQRMIDAASQAVINSNLETSKYSDIIDGFERGDLTQKEAEQEFAEQAGNDQILLNELHNHGLRGAYNLINSRNAKARDMWTSVASLENATTSRGKTVGAESAYDKSLDASADAGGGRALPGGPGEPAEPERPADQSPEDLDKQIMHDYHISKQALGDAKSLSRGSLSGETANAYKAANKEHGQQVIGAAAAIQRAENDIAASDEPDQDKKLEKLAKIDPLLAGRVGGLVNYNADPKSERDQRIRDMAFSVGGSKYSEDNYKKLSDMSDIHGQYGREVLRVAALGRAGTVLLKALKDIPENEKIPERQLEAMIAGNWTGDAKYSNLYAAIQNFVTEVGSVESGTGVARVTLTNALKEHMGSTGSPAQIRGGMWTAMNVAKSFYDTQVNTWNNIAPPGKENPIFKNNIDLQNYRDIINVDTQTGHIPIGQNTRPEIAALSKGETKFPPLSGANKEKIRQYFEQNKQLLNDPNTDAATRQQIQDAARALGQD